MAEEETPRIVGWAPWIVGSNGQRMIGGVAVNDPRIPPPAPDGPTLDPDSLNPIILPPGARQAHTATVEDDMPAKIGVYATGGDQFAVSVLDESNDPVDGGSFRFDAATIMSKIKPLLEAGGHKVVDYSAGALVEATAANVTPMRRSRGAK